MKYAILRTLDDPYIYDNEVEFMEKTFDTKCEAIAYIKGVLIPFVESKYAKDFPTGYHADTEFEESERKYRVTLYPKEGEYAHETRFEIIEILNEIDDMFSETSGTVVQSNNATIIKNTEEDIRKEAILEFLSELKKHCITSETIDSYGETVEPLMYTWFDDDINKLLKDRFDIDT